jgi:hypothetical protein
MTADITPAHIHTTAFHEAAHAVMAMMKRCWVSELVVYDEPREGVLGCCWRTPASHWMDDVWVHLAGPVADTINCNIEIREAFFKGGQSDFEKARARFGKLLYPRIPDELRDHIGEDVGTFLTLVCDGWVPEGLRGQCKRRFTLFANKCLEVDHHICSWIYDEAKRVREFMIDTPWFLEGVRHLADHLAEARHVTGEVMKDLLIKHYDESRVAA